MLIYDIRVFSPFAQSPKYFPQSVLQEKQAGEERSIWSTCQRSGAWSFFNIRRNWTNSQCGLPKNVLLDCPETWHDIQQDPPLHQMQTELLTFALSNYVPKGSKIQHSPPYNIPTMDLACHEGWVPLHWTEPTYIQTSVVLLRCCTFNISYFYLSC